ncbi:hypothetical protein P7C70_g8208, partial [Phenoliferia sp. Uapishka_3]
MTQRSRHPNREQPRGPHGGSGIVKRSKEQRDVQAAMEREARERKVTDAIGIADTEGISLREAAKRTGAAHATVVDRKNGILPRTKAHTARQLLTPEEERVLVEFCESMERRYIPVRQDMLVERARLILEARAVPSASNPSRHWREAFQRRHPELHLKTSRSIDAVRVFSQDPANLLRYFDELEEVIKEYNITPDRCYNFDEKGILLGVSNREKVFIVKREQRGSEVIQGKAGGLKQNGDRQTVTVIEAFSASGNFLDPAIIMKGKSVQQQWVRETKLPQNTRFYCSPNGWTDDILGLDYVQHVHAQTRHLCPHGEWILLLYDGHRSHLTVEFLLWAISHQILCVCLPSHTTGWTQPADVGIFYTLSICYHRVLSQSLRTDELISKSTFGKMYSEARKKAFTGPLIRKAFETAGVWPVNARKIPFVRAYLDRQASHAAAASTNDTENQSPSQIQQSRSTTTTTPISSPLNTPKRRRILTERSAELLHDPALSSPVRHQLSESSALLQRLAAKSALDKAELAERQKVDEAKKSRRGAQGPVGGKKGAHRVFRLGDAESLTAQADEKREAEESKKVKNAEAREKKKKAGEGKEKGKEKEVGVSVGEPRKRGRGRPRKVPAASPNPSASEGEDRGSEEPSEADGGSGGEEESEDSEQDAPQVTTSRGRVVKRRRL